MEHVGCTKLICIGCVFTLTGLTECFVERYFDYYSLMSPQILLRMLYSIPVLHLDVSYLLTYLITYSLTHSLTDLLTHSLTPLSGVLLEKLTGSQLVKKFPTFKEPKGSLPHSQVPATYPYPEPDESSTCPPPIPLP